VKEEDNYPTILETMVMGRLGVPVGIQLSMGCGIYSGLFNDDSSQYMQMAYE